MELRWRIRKPATFSVFDSYKRKQALEGVY
jgi:hypothetical protein